MWYLTQAWIQLCRGLSALITFMDDSTYDQEIRHRRMQSEKIGPYAENTDTQTTRDS